MAPDDLVPLFAIGLACFALAGVIARRSGFYRRLLRDEPPGRTPMIDGLRGWLALAVFFAHAAAMRALVGAGTWPGPAPSLFGIVGEIGVALFFMITGFLFWGRVLHDGPRLDMRALLRARIRRLLPMYLVSVAAVLAVVAARSDFALRVPLAELIRQIRPWLSFGFQYAGDINGVAGAHYINAVYWTLAHEWRFYLALPLLAVVFRGRAVLLALPLAVLFCLQVPVTLNFIGGAVAAVLAARTAGGLRLDGPLLGLVPLAALAAVCLLPTAFSLPASLLLFAGFLCVVGGNPLFGLLAAPASRLLGSISYSFYLTHCIVLHGVVHAVDPLLPVRTMSPALYWLVAAFAALLTVGLSALGYRYVEAPFCRPGASAARGGAAADGAVPEALAAPRAAR